MAAQVGTLSVSIGLVLVILNAKRKHWDLGRYLGTLPGHLGVLYSHIGILSANIVTSMNYAGTLSASIVTLEP